MNDLLRLAVEVVQPYCDIVENGVVDICWHYSIVLNRSSKGGGEELHDQDRQFYS